MKLRAHLAPALLALIASTLVVGCGGGNDQDAGSQTAFNIAPSTVTVSGPDAATCGSGYAARVYAYGGAGPYKVYNTAPDVIALSKTLLDRPGDFFDVTLLGGCLTNIPIVVVDALGKQATFTVNATKGATTGGST